MKRLISIVVPAYNEALVLSLLCRRLRETLIRIPKYTFEIIIVENGSTDNSMGMLLKERMKDKRIKIVQLTKNVGLDNGLIAGLTHAHGDATIVMNADLQDDPKLIPQFINKWEKGYDMVYAIIRSRKGMSQVHQLLVRILYKGLYLLTVGGVPENVSDYRLLDRSLYAQILTRSHRFMFFRVTAALRSKNAIGIAYDRPQRMRGTSKMNIADNIAEIRNAVITIIVHLMPPVTMRNAIRNQPLYTVKRTYGLRIRLRGKKLLNIPPTKTMSFMMERSSVNLRTCIKITKIHGSRR